MIDSTVTVPASRSVSTTVLLVSSLLRFLWLSSACTSLLASKTLRLSLAAKMTTVASLFRVARCGAETSLIRMMRFVMQNKLQRRLTWHYSVGFLSEVLPRAKNSDLILFFRQVHLVTVYLLKDCFVCSS